MWQILAGAAARVIGGAVGKAVGKIIDYIPSKEEKRRADLKKYRRELNELIKQKQDIRNTARVEYLMERIRLLEERAEDS